MFRLSKYDCLPVSSTISNGYPEDLTGFIHVPCSFRSPVGKDKGLRWLPFQRHDFDIAKIDGVALGLE